MNPLFYILTATILISLASLIGIITLSINEKKLSRILLFLVALSAGALMGGAFLHLLPEAAEKVESGMLFAIVLASFVLFFFVEKVIHWHHCHDGKCETHTFGYMNLVGDSIHNFIDGLVIAGTFLVDVKLGMAASLAVALHEIPQEIGDFGVLLYAGFEKKKALLLNLLAASIAILGGIAGYFLSFYIEAFTMYLLPFAAGGFIYIGASDLMPEIRKEENLKKSVISFTIFLAGILLMYLLKLLGI